MFKFQLALNLHMTVAELDSKLGAFELNEWLAYYKELNKREGE